MKDFFKYVLATVVGLILFFLVAAVLGTMSIVGMVASEQATQNVGKNSVLVLPLSGMIQEQDDSDPVGRFIGNAASTQGLNKIVSAIKKAKDNDNIKGIYIEAGMPQAGYATLQEIRNALLDFKKSKKWIVAYGDTYSQGAYYVASVADKVWVNPQGSVDWHGIASQPVFYKDLMAKFGVRMQVVKVGTYKSYTETYTEDHMSEANRLQVTAYIGALWNNIVEAVGQSRKLSPESLNAYADRMVQFEDAENLKKYKLVDELLYADQVKEQVKKLLGLDADDEVSQVSVADMQNVKERKHEGDEIAVYYAFGSVVQSEAGGLTSQGRDIVADDVCKDLQELADDDDVKAVVLRVNSGGGSAYASEQIWHAVMKLKAKKPVVVSMGDYAASGAYYLSCPANWIVAQPNTLTGSIGIFAAIPDMSGLITQKLGVKFDEVKTNRNSSFGNLMARPFNAEELGYLQSYVNRGYQLFTKRVADGRHQSVEAIDKIAQGRVWAAEDALKVKLVDQIGGLEDAVKKAASLAKMDKYYTADYPAPADWMQTLLNDARHNNYLDEQLRLTLGDIYEPFALMRNLNNQEALQARIPFALGVK